MRIAIVGCGVAGQALAIALSRAGHEATVFERFETARPLGAGLLLQPSGLHALETLGLREAAERLGAPIRELDGRILSGRRVLDIRYPDGERGLGLHRASLFDLLNDALSKSGARLELGFEVSRVDDLMRPALVSRAGSRAGPFDLVVDCAGAHDALRETLGIGARAPLYPWGALWTTCPDPDGAFEGKLRQTYDRARLMIGVLPIGRAPENRGERCVALFWSLRLQDVDAERAEGLSALKARAMQAWPEIGPILGRIARYEDFALATYRDVRLATYRKGRVVVIGDAAHATSPQLGQGANLALIDAVTLAYFLSEERDIDRALAFYERERKAHIAFYRLASRALTPAFQSERALAPWLRDWLLPWANRVPGGRHLTRTTLAGVRKFPFGVWKPPSSIRSSPAPKGPASRRRRRDSRRNPKPEAPRADG